MISSLLPVLLGGNARPETSAPETPVAGERDFVLALLRAFGAGGAEVEAVDPSEDGMSASDLGTGSADAEQGVLSDGGGDGEPRLAFRPATAQQTGPMVAELGESISDLSAGGLANSPSSSGGGPERVSRGEALDASRDRRGEPSSLDAEPLSPPEAFASVTSPLARTPADARMPADVTVADRSRSRLAPDLRSKLDRVVERMSTEYGHDVRVIEGYRSPERQAHLFEQGRSRPGPVVTWTLDSEHNSGRAVDVLVDGSFEPTSGYARLQKVAAEEGLRTLGMRDPGHLELPSSQVVRTAALPGRQEASIQLQEAPSSFQEAPQAQLVQSSDGIARPARVAEVADLAQIARVAEIARIARPGENRPARSAEAVARPTTAPNGAIRDQVPVPVVIPEPAPRQPINPVRTGAVFAQGLGAAADDTGDAMTSKGSKRRRPVDAVSANLSLEPSEQAQAAAIDLLATGTRGAISRVGASNPLPGLTSMARVEQVLEAQALAEGSVGSRVSIRLDGTTGPIESVRVGLMGRTVHADLDVAGADTAAFIRSRVSELHGALEGRGLELGSFGVNGPVTELYGEGVLGNRADATSDLLRSLLGTSNGGESTRDGSSRGRWEQHRTNDDGSGSGRPRHETGEED